MEDSVSSLFWSRKGAAWSIDVHKCCSSPEAEYTVFLTGRHEALWRSREMDGEFFVEIVDCAQRLWKEWPHLREDCRTYFAELPSLPSAALKGRVCFGSCQIQLLAHKDQDDIVPTLAMYDAEDQSAPVLYAVGSDIERLIEDLSQASAATGIEKAA